MLVALLILLLIAAVTGVLGAVLEVTLVIVLSLVLAVMVLAWFGTWYAKRRFRAIQREMEERMARDRRRREAHDIGPHPADGSPGRIEPGR